jgi:hypothetical protein
MSYKMKFGPDTALKVAKATHTHYNDPDVELKEAEKLLADAKNILEEAEKLRLYGVRIQAQAYGLKAKALEAKEKQ